MGQQISIKVREDMALQDAIDRISAHYIIMQTSEDMELFTHEEFCNIVATLLSEVFSKNIRHLDSQLILQRINKGSKAVDVTEFVPRTIETQPEKEDYMVIARFYVRIAHLYSIIARALNISDLVDIEQRAQRMSKTNRLESIKSLVDNQLRNVRLAEEIYGLEEKMQKRREKLPNLAPLYFDVYDPSAQLYTGMSEKAQTKFTEDIKDFYKGFTGEDMPSEISFYSDIPLSKSCKSQEGTETQLFKQYGQRLAHLVLGAKKTNEELLKILDKIIVEHEGVKTIHPELTVDKLNKLIEGSREVIIGEYMENDNNYMEGLEVFEAVIEELLGKTKRSQLDILNSQLFVLISQ